MATLTVQEFDEAGNDLTLSSAAAGGDEFPNSGQELLVVKNGSGSSMDVTITAQVNSFDDASYGNAVKENQTLSVAAGGVALLGPFSRKSFNDGSGNVQVSYSDETSVEVAAVRKE